MKNLDDLKNMDGVSFQIMKITPEYAKKIVGDTQGFVQRNSHNSTILEYAQMMSSGQWTLNYEPIMIGVKGNCIDGLHRLKACVHSNTEFQSLVIYGVPDSIFENLDRGRARTLGDILSTKDLENYNAIAASIGVIFNLENYHFPLAIGSASGVNRHLRLSPAKMIDFLSKHPDFPNFISQNMKVHKNGSKLITQSRFLGLWYFCSKYNALKCDDFFSKLSSGVNLSEDSPIFYIRKKLLMINRKESYLGATEIVNLILRGFEMYCSDEKVNKLITVPKEPIKLKNQIKLF